MPLKGVIELVYLFFFKVKVFEDRVDLGSGQLAVPLSFLDQCADLVFFLTHVFCLLNALFFLLTNNTHKKRKDLFFSKRSPVDPFGGRMLVIILFF